MFIDLQPRDVEIMSSCIVRKILDLKKLNIEIFTSGDDVLIR